MIRLFTLIVSFSLGAASFGQVFESNLSSWADGVPDDMMGTKSSISPSNVVESMDDVVYGTSKALLINESGDHKRFTTQSITVVGGESYEIKMWVSGNAGELRTSYFNITDDDWNAYNDYMDISAETGGDLTMLSQTVTVAATCTEAEFILSLRNTDATGITLDSISIATITLEPTVLSIYDIQYATEAPYESAYEGELVETSGIVTGVFQTGGDAGRFFIQDGSGDWNGIYVYDNSTEVTIGDSVTVIGEVDEYYELTELTAVVSVEVHGSDYDLPEAVEVATGDVINEQYEGVLVRVVDAECTNEDAGYGQFEVNDASGARLIDDEIFSYTPALGSYYTITGVTNYSFGEMKIYPRSIEDIIVTGVAGIEENENTISIYPNPANSIVNVNVNSTATITIYSVTGEMVYTANGNVKTIDVSEFSAGVYHVVIIENETTATQRLVVE